MDHHSIYITDTTLLFTRKAFNDACSSNYSHIFSFFTDGHDLPMDSRQSTFNNGTLIIKRPRKILDQGYYTCSASDDRHDSHSGSIQVKVISEFLQGQATYLVACPWFLVQQCWSANFSYWE